MGEFERFSAEIGRRPELVQGAGGNMSEKSGGRMRIKASGAWLADALDKPVFVDVDLDKLRDALAVDFDEAALKEALASDAELRPSIETPLHALAPFAYVAHVHSVNAIAWSVRTDARERLAERLDGLDWAFIPYARPGAPLAKSVRAVFASSRPCALILGNHGLVAAADGIAPLRDLMDEIERRLAPAADAPAAEAPSGDASAPGFAVMKPSPPPGYRWVDNSACDFLAHDAARRAIAAKGSLYPDHVVFLGPAMTLARTVDEAAMMIPPPKAAIVPGTGVLARTDLTKGALAMLDCLGLVLARLDPAAPVNYLSAEDEAALLGWDAEAHRQALDRRAGRA